MEYSWAARCRIPATGCPYIILCTYLPRLVLPKFPHRGGGGRLTCLVLFALAFGQGADMVQRTSTGNLIVVVSAQLELVMYRLRREFRTGTRGFGGGIQRDM